MPPQPGEVSLLTVYADIHYFFGPPEIKAPHHRFDKRSYVYLYHDATQGRRRIEIANNTGTPEQDAFTGSLDLVQMAYSHKHPVLVTITVDGQQIMDEHSAATEQGRLEWHLRAPDWRNGGRYMYKLHTVDIYFWTENDACLFVDAARRMLGDSQLRILDAAPISTNPSHASKGDATSPVVQQLEDVAISKPNGVQTDRPDIHQSSALPAEVSSEDNPTSHSPEGSLSYAPIAYNPAAPAAPEPIAHREKTPPPPDAAHRTGLTAATEYEHANQGVISPVYQTSYQPQPLLPSLQPYHPGSPQSMQTFAPPPPPPPPAVSGTPLQNQQMSGAYPPPPPSAESVGSPSGQQYQQSFAGPRQDPNPHVPTPSQHHLQQPLQRTSSHGSPVYALQPQYAYSSAPSQQQFATHYQSAGYASPQSPSYAPTPGHIPIQSSGPSQAFSQPVVQSPSPGGYSQYPHAQPRPQHSPPQTQTGEYSVHSQFYMPAQAEAWGRAPKSVTRVPGQAPGRLEQRAERLEKGVGRFLKRLDKKL